MTETPKVYTAIAAVMADVSREGIAKDRKNEQQKYKFRGIDDVYNALSPILAKNGLCVLPRVLSRDVIERRSSAGSALFYTTVEVEFDFVAASDGSTHVVKTFGEAMDSGDKATNKAMSAAYKYACMQAFCIPTEGDNDADATTHTVAAKEPPEAPEKPTLPKTRAREPYAKLEAALDAFVQPGADANANDIAEWWESKRAEIFKLPTDWQGLITSKAIQSSLQRAGSMQDLRQAWKYWAPQFSALPEDERAACEKVKDETKAFFETQGVEAA